MSKKADRKRKYRKIQQLDFFGKPRCEHGGDIRKSKRKLHRPLDTRLPLHIIMHSEKAKGQLALINHQHKINKIIRKWARIYLISIYEIAIVSNHIHILIRGKKKESVQNFFRVITGLIARQVTKAKKGKPFGRFWTNLLYSKLLKGGKRQFQIVREYIIQNTLESLGLIAYRPRKNGTGPPQRA